MWIQFELGKNKFRNFQLSDYLFWRVHIPVNIISAPPQNPMQIQSTQLCNVISIAS